MSASKAQPPHELIADGLTVARGGRLLFSGLGFVVPGGSVLLLKGPNGAGKTSLLLTLAGVIHPEAGSVAFRQAGAPADLSPQTHILLPQNGMKPRLTVAENLSFWRAMNGAGGHGIEIALERVGLGGLEPIEAGHLSTGQLKRLALGRLLVSRRPVWLLDEPTAALDSEGEALVANLLNEHCSGGGLAVVATHQEIAISGVASQAIVIAGGAARREAAA